MLNYIQLFSSLKWICCAGGEQRVCFRLVKHTTIMELEEKRREADAEILSMFLVGIVRCE